MKEKSEKQVSIELEREVQHEGCRMEDKVEEVVRIGKYIGGHQPLKVRFRS